MNRLGEDGVRRYIGQDSILFKYDFKHSRQGVMQARHEILRFNLCLQ